MMADKSDTQLAVPTEVNELLEERQKIQGWIEGLEAFENETSDDVYLKVLTDYESRLEDLSARLSEHRGSIEDSVTAHGAAVGALAEERASRSSELEESRLRHAVGEYDDKEWGKRREKAESAIAELDEKLAGEQNSLSDLQQILAGINGEPIPERIGAENGSEPAAEVTLEDGAVDEAVSEPEAPEASDPAPDAASETAQEAVPAGVDAAVDKDAESGSSDEEYLDELEFLESLSLDEADRFDAVSAMLDDDEGKEKTDRTP